MGGGFAYSGKITIKSGLLFIGILLIGFLFGFAVTNYKPLRLNPDQQQFAKEIRQLQPGDLLVDNSGEVMAVVRQIDQDRIEIRNTLNTRWEAEVFVLATISYRLRPVRKGSPEYLPCATAYAKKERCLVK